MKVTYVAIYRSLDIMNELDIKFIFLEVDQATYTKVLDIMNELDIKFIFLEVDQATYTKVLDAMFKVDAEGFEILKKVIPRMGGFRIDICVLRTIYEQFNKCGIIQLLFTAGIEGKVRLR